MMSYREMLYVLYFDAVGLGLRVGGREVFLRMPSFWLSWSSSFRLFSLLSFWLAFVGVVLVPLKDSLFLVGMRGIIFGCNGGGVGGIMSDDDLPVTIRMNPSIASAIKTPTMTMNNRMKYSFIYV
jgi:hypothetical protein